MIFPSKYIFILIPVDCFFKAMLLRYNPYAVLFTSKMFNLMILPVFTATPAHHHSQSQSISSPQEYSHTLQVSFLYLLTPQPQATTDRSTYRSAYSRYLCKSCMCYSVVALSISIFSIFIHVTALTVFNSFECQIPSFTYLLFSEQTFR